MAESRPSLPLLHEWSAEQNPHPSTHPGRHFFLSRFHLNTAPRCCARLPPSSPGAAASCTRSSRPSFRLRPLPATCGGGGSGRHTQGRRVPTAQDTQFPDTGMAHQQAGMWRSTGAGTTTQCCVVLRGVVLVVWHVLDPPGSNESVAPGTSAHAPPFPSPACWSCA